MLTDLRNAFRALRAAPANGARPGLDVHGHRLVIGLGGAWALSRLVQAFLFQVTPRDPLVYVVVALMLAGAGLVAALVPALRASRVDPLVALRME